MSSGSEEWSGSEGDYKKKSKKKDKSKDKDKKEKKDKDKGYKDKGHKDKDKKDKKDKDKKDKDKDKDRQHEGASSGHGFSDSGNRGPVGGGHAAEYFSSTTVSTPGHFQAPIPGQGAPPPPPYGSAPGFPQAGMDIKSPQFPGAPSPPSMGGTAPPMGGGFPQAGVDIKSPQFPGAPHPPPAPMGGSAPPPSGYRVPLRTDSSFPPPDQTGPPISYDADGVSPLFIGSALFETSVQPCKIGPHLQPSASVPYGGAEYSHQGRYDLLPFVPDQMEFVQTGYGQIPAGRRPIEGGYEENGGKLYHALGDLNGLKVPGKTGEHLGGANVAYGGQEIVLQQYKILCWK